MAGCPPCGQHHWEERSVVHGLVAEAKSSWVLISTYMREGHATRRACAICDELATQGRWDAMTPRGRRGRQCRTNSGPWPQRAAPGAPGCTRTLYSRARCCTTTPASSPCERMDVSSYAPGCSAARTQSAPRSCRRELRRKEPPWPQQTKGVARLWQTMTPGTLGSDITLLHVAWL